MWMRGIEKKRNIQMARVALSHGIMGRSSEAHNIGAPKFGILWYFPEWKISRMSFHNNTLKNSQKPTFQKGFFPATIFSQRWFLREKTYKINKYLSPIILRACKFRQFLDTRDRF